MMPKHQTIEDLFRKLAEDDGLAVEERAPSRLKARLYSALIRAQQQTGRLQSLTETRESGRGLCIFEELVQIAPIGERAKSPFFCWTCHARVMAEAMEHPPLIWGNCPYASFRK
jgi:hypothetical protein